MKHPTKVEKYSGTNRELARDIINMRYDSLAEFFEYLSEELLMDAKNDESLGHKDVTNKLKKLAEDNSKSKEDALSLWKICEKHMK
jgi:hypothetical protein